MSVQGRTHAVLGACAAVPIAILMGGGLALWVCAAAGAFSGLLPDIDHPGSTLGRWVPWPAVAVENHRTGFVAHGRRWFGGRTVWHRHETHSVGAAGIAALLALGVTCWPLARLADWAGHHGAHLPVAPGIAGLEGAAGIAATVLVGYLSHLIADMANPSPQMLLWPFSRRMVHPKWAPAIREASSAGRWIEHGAALVAILAAVAVWGGRPV